MSDLEPIIDSVPPHWIAVPFIAIGVWFTKFLLGKSLRKLDKIDRLVDSVDALDDRTARVERMTAETNRMTGDLQSRVARIEGRFVERDHRSPT